MATIHAPIPKKKMTNPGFTNSTINSRSPMRNQITAGRSKRLTVVVDVDTTCASIKSKASSIASMLPNRSSAIS